MKRSICIITAILFITIQSAWAQNSFGTKSSKGMNVPDEFVNNEYSLEEQLMLDAKELTPESSGQVSDNPKAYTIGVDDIIEISVLQPDQLLRVVNVAPDGMISFPYIGSIKVKDLTIPEVQKKIQDALADGYLNHPVVLVSLQESRSRNFFVYGEVVKPGNYAISENTTVLRAISMAGGFTKFGSSSNVKLLRPRINNLLGYQTIKIDIKKLMNGDVEEDQLLMPGDMVVVSEGVF